MVLLQGVHKTSANLNPKLKQKSDLLKPVTNQYEKNHYDARVPVRRKPLFFNLFFHFSGWEAWSCGNEDDRQSENKLRQSGRTNFRHFLKECLKKIMFSSKSNLFSFSNLARVNDVSSNSILILKVPNCQQHTISFWQHKITLKAVI